MSNKLHSIAETAESLGVSKDTVRRLIESGAVKSVRIARRVMVPESEVERACTHGVGARGRGRGGGGTVAARPAYEG
jgi:excisionase family DNA binding protein